MRLLYVMDPMCSWCYAFQPELEAFLAHHPSADIDWVMGGLAPDTRQPMDENLKQTISTYWHEIEDKTQVTFNHDFWNLNTPYRSTYPACRAVIAVEMLKANSAQQMAKAIQSAYYLEAKNPSLEETLIACANSIDIDENQFIDVLKAKETEQRFQQHLAIAQRLQIRGFPALLYINDNNQAYPLTLGFMDANGLEQQFNKINDRHSE